MSLSEQELRALQEIEKSLLDEDPNFGASVSKEPSFAGYSGAFTLRGVALIVVGLLMLVGGVALAQQSLWFIVISVVGFLLMFAAGVWMLRGHSTGAAAASGPVHPSRRKVKRQSGTGTRLEDNFRRRFEGS